MNTLLLIAGTGMTLVAIGAIYYKLNGLKGDIDKLISSNKGKSFWGSVSEIGTKLLHDSELRRAEKERQAIQKAKDEIQKEHQEMLAKYDALYKENEVLKVITKNINNQIKNANSNRTPGGTDHNSNQPQ